MTCAGRRRGRDDRRPDQVATAGDELTDPRGVKERLVLLGSGLDRHKVIPITSNMDGRAVVDLDGRDLLVADDPHVRVPVRGQLQRGLAEDPGPGGLQVHQQCFRPLVGQHDAGAQVRGAGVPPLVGHAREFDVDGLDLEFVQEAGVLLFRSPPAP